MKTLVAVLGALLALTGVAAAQDVCFQLQPFDDVLLVDVEGLHLKVDWVGNTSYKLTGQGDAGVSRDGTVYTLHTTLHNPSPFFGGNPVARLHAVVDVNAMTGPWAIDTMQSTTSNPEFHQAGTLAPIGCPGSEALSSSQQGLRFGAQSLAGQVGLK